MVVTEELLNYSVMEHQLELKCLDQREPLMLVVYQPQITVNTNAVDAVDPFITGILLQH